MSMIPSAANIGGMTGLQPMPGVNAVRGLAHEIETARISGAGSGSALMAAMTSALAQAGIPVTASPDLAQASMRSFMPTLLGALHQVASTHHADMSGLLQRVAAAAHANPVLQHSFQSLIGALGAPHNPAALGTFLQALAGKLQGASAIGSVVSTSA
jgi:hypothetical protein